MRSARGNFSPLGSPHAPGAHLTLVSWHPIALTGSKGMKTRRIVREPPEESVRRLLTRPAGQRVGTASRRQAKGRVTVRMGSLELALVPCLVAVDDSVSLTPQEGRVLGALWLSGGCLSRKELKARLWPGRLPSSNVFNVLLSQLRTKLAAHDVRLEAVGREEIRLTEEQRGRPSRSPTGSPKRRER